MMRLFVIGACAVCLLVLTSVAGAGMLTYEHLDNNNPEGEGWARQSGGSYTAAADAGPPLNWKIDCNAVASCRYRVFPEVAEFADPLGWTSTVRMQFNVGDLGQVRNTVLTGVLNLGWTWDDDVNGVPEALVSGYGAEATLSSLGVTHNPTDGFHYYQIVYDPVGAGAADDVVTWYLDGTSVFSKLASELNTHTARFYYFGDGNGSTGTPPSESQWALARLESGMHPIPEPSTAVLLVLGGVLLGVLRFRRK